MHDCFDHQRIDRIWLATGTQLDIATHPLLGEMVARCPIEIVNGLPVLDKYLRWSGCHLFLMGPWSALQVGPVARNLFGAKLACDRIVPALTKASIGTMRALVKVNQPVNSGQDDDQAPVIQVAAKSEIPSRHTQLAPMIRPS